MSMTYKQPTEKDIEAAKAYLRQRLEAERSMEYNLGVIMREAATRIVEICYSANVNPQNFRYEDLPLRTKMEIDEVIRWLEETIDDYFQTLAVADHEENRDIILPFVLGENHGATFDERLADYCDKYKDELMLLVGAGLFLGVGKVALAKSIGENLKHPYANQLLAGGIDAPISYGRGRSNSMYNAIGSLTRNGIAAAWMKNFYMDTRKDGCVGWLVRRGSNCPCEICQSYVGLQTSEENLPPFHMNCVCYAVPVYI